jgi:uncharacterized MnhB-related membrane protein
MRQSLKTYVGLVIVFLMPFWAGTKIPMDEVFKGIAAMPAVGVLMFAIYRIFRDQSAFERQ